MISEKPDQERVGEEVFIFPASFAQQRLWFIEQLLPGDSLYVIPLVFRLTGSLARSQLDQSIQAIVCRHEILRTTFDVVDGQLVQVIAPELQVPLRLADLRALPASTREDAALDQIWQEIQQPFHLAEGPLLRVGLWQLHDTEHLLLMALHHIIFDEWSSGVLIRELGQLYAALVEDKPAALPELPIQYADFAHWQREWLQGEVLNAQLRYWKQQLKDVPVLNLPGATSRSLVQGHRGASQLLELPQPLLDALEELSQQAGVTLFMTMLAAFQTLLHRYTGQTDIAIGSPIANRHRSELEGLIGFLVNSLVLRTNLAGDPTFRELLGRVQDTTLAAYAYQDLPFEKLVEELQPVRSLGQNPLFQVVFALQNTPMEQLVLPGLVLSPVELETKTSRFDLELYLWKCADNFRNLWGKGWQQSDGLRGVVVYNTDVFDSTTIASLRHHFQTLLEGIVANPDTHLSALPLLTTEEQRELLHHWSSNQSSYPTNACIHQLFEAQVRQRPTRRAVTFGDQQFTYQELNQGSNQLARYLQRLGIGAETPVGICLERSAAAIAAMLAVLKAGGAYVPLDPSYPQERLHFMLKDAGIAVVLTQAGWADLFPTDRTTVICLEREWGEIAQESDENLSKGASQFCENTKEWEHLAPLCERSGQDAFESRGQDARTTNLQKRDAPNLSTPCTGDREALPPGHQLAYIIYTSGSTGTPKGVLIPHQAVNRLVCETNYVQIEPTDRIAQVANLAFDAATFEIWGALLNGAELIGIEREITLSPTNFVTELQQQQISILFLTTALFNQTVSQIPAAFQSLKYLLFGGEMVNVDRVRSVLQQGKPQHLIHVYGPTENTTFSTGYEVQDVPDNATTIPIGQGIANTQVYLLDANLSPVPAGVRGEIYLGGDGLARGYLNRPDLTAEKFIDSPFLGNRELGIGHGEESPTPHSLLPTPLLYKTGDRALYHPDGNLEFLGRTDYQIKIRGFRVELGEIETVIAQHPAVQTAVVVVRELESDSLGETIRDRQLIAYVVPKASAIPTGASQFCKSTSSGSILLPDFTNTGQNFTNTGQNFTDASQDFTNASQDFTNANQDFTNVGKDFTNANQDFINVGKDFTNANQDFTNASQDFTDAGQDFTNVSQDFTNVGKNFTDVGKDFTDAGQDFTNANQDFTNVGKDFTNVGQDFTNVGQDFTNVGQDFTNVGQDFTNVGQDFTNVGQDFTNAGQDFTDVGKMPTLQIYKNGMLPIPTERELRTFLKTKLPAYMVPAAFVVLDTLPLTVNGKVNQKALPPPNLNVGRETSPVVAPTTSLEAALVELWTQLLGRKPVGIHDNFFELGGHSLLATQLVSRIRDQYQVELPLRSVFETPTIAELAQKIEALGWVAQADSSSWMNRWQESGSQRREEVEL